MDARPDPLAAYLTALQQPMTERQRALFRAEYAQIAKSRDTAFVLALLVGGVGAHRFYLGDMTGILYALFFWTLLPAVVSFLEAWTMGARVDAYNQRQADLIAARILAAAGV